MKKQSAVAKKSASNAAPAYKNPSLPSARRVKDLLSRMTLEEKAAQMMCVWQKKAETLVDAEGNFDLGQSQEPPSRTATASARSGRPSDAGRGQERARAWRS